MRFRLFMVIVIAALVVAACGCVLKPTPTPSSTPLPTVTVTPQPQWPPSTIGTIKSSQVVVDDVKVTYNRDVKTMQSEDFSILLTNYGRDWANNTFITLRESDSLTGQEYYDSPQVNVGNMSPRSSKWINISTGTHDYGFSVYVQMEWFWGENIEFHNTYKKSFTLAPVASEYAR